MWDIIDVDPWPLEVFVLTLISLVTASCESSHLFRGFLDGPQPYILPLSSFGVVPPAYCFEVFES